MRKQNCNLLFVLFIVSIFTSCELGKKADDNNNNTLPCGDALPVSKFVNYDNLSMWGVPHVETPLEGSYRVFSAKWDVNVMCCPQDTIKVNIKCYMTQNQPRPILLRAYLECQFGQGHDEPIPLTETDDIWTNVGNPASWSFFPGQYYTGYSSSYFVVHVDYLVPNSGNFFDDLNYLYANAQDISLYFDASGWQD